MNQCINQNLFEQYIDGSLDQGKERQIEEHLQHCAICSENASRWTAVWDDFAGPIGQQPLTGRENDIHSPELEVALEKCRNLASNTAMDLSGLSDSGKSDFNPYDTGQNLRSGDSLGPYQILRLIASGGMGTVYAAEQLVPVQRQVALKVIKRGFGSKQVLARFEAERQALALMNHPNIARILDAGTTPDGQPYFAMELVPGKAITKYCDEKKLGIDERLALFIDVCTGVQHAHQKGIIHRDLKPSNILVEEVDGSAIPKIIDFGLAKAIESTQRLTDQSLFTGIGQILGTLKYMSPEQASLDKVDIDTRADIYALGVILYELLTGSTPLDNHFLKEQGALKILGIILEQDPVKPSSRLGSSSKDHVSTITGQRRTDRLRLGRILAGDLDWIVMKALEKDRSRRYETASGFAADIRRYVNNEPVIARPPTWKYRLRKFVRKNRVFVLSASLIVLALIGGILGTSLAMFRAMRAETLADQRSEESVKNLAYAKKGNEILGSVFEVLDPEIEFHTVWEFRNFLSENLENAARQLEASSIADPLAVAEMQLTLGSALKSLGQYEPAIALLEKVVATREAKLGSGHLETIKSMNNLANGYRLAGLRNQALPLMEKALEQGRRHYGLNHRVTIVSMNNLANEYLAAGRPSEAIPLFEQSLALAKANLDDEKLTLSLMADLAYGYSEAGQMSKAFSLFGTTIELMGEKLGEQHSATLKLMVDIADGYYKAGDPNEALSIFIQVRNAYEEKYGPDHPSTIISMHNLAKGLQQTGQFEKALPIYQRALDLMTKKFGTAHPDTITCMEGLASAHRALGQTQNAISLSTQTLELSKETLGHDHPKTLLRMNYLGLAYFQSNQFEKALSIWDNELFLRKTKFGLKHPLTLSSMNNCAVAFWRLGQLDQSIPMFEELVELRQELMGRQDPETLSTVADLGVNYKDAGRLDEAIPLLEEAFEARRKIPELSGIRDLLISAYLEGKRVESFRLLANEDLSEARKNFPDESLELADSLEPTAKSFIQLGLFREAAELLREVTDIRTKHAPGSWESLNAKSLWGEALLGQAVISEVELEKAPLLAEAEPLLLAGYEGLKELEEDLPIDGALLISRAIDRMIKLYSILENSAEFEKWKLERETYSGSKKDL